MDHWEWLASFFPYVNDPYIFHPFSGTLTTVKAEHLVTGLHPRSKYVLIRLWLNNGYMAPLSKSAMFGCLNYSNHAKMIWRYLTISYLVLGSISLIHYKLQTFFSKNEIFSPHDLIYPDILYGYTPYVLAMSNHFRGWYHAISCNILIGAAPFCSFQAKQGFSET